MRPVYLLIFLSLFIYLSSAAIAQETGETKVVVPDTKVNIYRIPQDAAKRAEALNQIFNNVTPGNGSAFMFNTLFTPSNAEQSSLRPGLVLKNQSSPPFSFQGYCITRDATGLRAVRFGNRFINNQTESVGTIYAGGNRIYRWKSLNDSKPVDELIDNNYLDYDVPGINYFMNSINMRGVIIGQRMDDLLVQTDARRIGVERIRGTRTIVYGIQPANSDLADGLKYLKVWVRVGDTKLIRTNLDLTYGREFTEYSQHLTDVKFDDEKFLCPGETVDDLLNEYEKILSPKSAPESDVKAKPDSTTDAATRNTNKKDTVK